VTQKFLHHKERQRQRLQGPSPPSRALSNRPFGGWLFRVFERKWNWKSREKKKEEEDTL